MDRFNCSAISCAHNYGGNCGAAAIHIRGGSTSRASKTFCNTYTHAQRSLGGDYNFEIAVELTGADPPKVNCSAIRCMHNENYSCAADALKIIDPTTSREKHSECASFETK